MDGLDPLLDSDPVTALHLSTHALTARFQNAIKGENDRLRQLDVGTWRIETIGDLRETSDAEFLRMTNIGRKTLREMRAALREVLPIPTGARAAPRAPVPAPSAAPLDLNLESVVSALQRGGVAQEVCAYIADIVGDWPGTSARACDQDYEDLKAIREALIMGGWIPSRRENG